MTIRTAQMDFDLEAHQSEVQALRIAMNPKLFKAATSGDIKILGELLQQEEFFSRDSVGQITITIPDDAATQNDANYLLGVTREGNTALHIVATRGHLELAKEICHRERSLLAAPNTRLDTPLHCAARAGDDKMVSLIIQFAREDGIEERVLKARNREEANALHEAAQYDHVRVAEVLMEQDAGLASMLNGAGMSPLYLAIMTGSFNVAKALLQSSSWSNASPASYAGPNKKTALHAAVRMSQEITREILQRKPMLAKDADSSGRIPLHYAASDGLGIMVKLLLKHDPSTAYQSDADGFFPIHIAAMMDNFWGVYQILNQCPDTYELLDNEGKNFLHAAFQKRRLVLIRKIIRKRRGLRKLLNDRDNQGNTPLHTAVENSDQWSVHFLLRDKTVNVNIMNHDGFTPLDLAYAKLENRLYFLMWIGVKESEFYSCRKDISPIDVWLANRELDKDAEHCIACCLALIKALPGPCLKRVALSSNATNEKPSGEKKEKEMDVSRNFGIASALIATVTFAAGFTVPGGYIADDHPGRGTTVLAKEYAFKVFLISDAFAFVSSIVATFWLVYAGTLIVDRYTRRRALFGALACIQIAFAGMSTAFGMGIYVVMATNCKRVSILLAIIAVGTPLFAHMVSSRNMYSVAKTIIIRQGCRHCIYPTIYPYIRKKLPVGMIYGGGIFPIMSLLLFCQAIFFLLAML